MTAMSAPEIVFSDSMTDLNAWDNASRISPLWTGSAWHQRSGGLEAIHYSLDLEGHSSGASTVPLFNELEGQAISASTGLLFNELEGLAGGASTAVLFNEVERNFDWVDRPRIGGIHKFRFFLYATCTGRPEMILADFGVAGEKAEVEAEFDPEYRRIVDELRSGGRELLASDVIEMLRASQEDPDEANIQLFSLEAMAHFLIKQQKFADPVAGPDPHGVMQIEWHIIGNGLLVMAFLEDDQIHCVAQADASPQGVKLNVSVQLTQDRAVKEFSHLVPIR